MLQKCSDLINRVAALSERSTADAAAQFGVDIDRSGAARFGSHLITLSMFIQVLTPIIAIGAMIALSAIGAFAQSPGGTIFGDNDQTTSRGIVEFIKWFRNLIFVAGVFFFGWAGLNLGFEKPWGMKAMAGVACWAFAGLAALAYSFSQGKAVDFDTDLGN